MQNIQKIKCGEQEENYSERNIMDNLVATSSGIWVELFDRLIEGALKVVSGLLDTRERRYECLHGRYLFGRLYADVHFHLQRMWDPIPSKAYLPILEQPRPY